MSYVYFSFYVLCVWRQKKWKLSKGKSWPQTTMPTASFFKEMFKFNHYVWTSSAYNHIVILYLFSKELLLMLPNLYFLSKHCSQASFSLRFPWIWQQLGSQCIAVQYLLFSVFLYEKKIKNRMENTYYNFKYLISTYLENKHMLSCMNISHQYCI